MFMLLSVMGNWHFLFKVQRILVSGKIIKGGSGVWGTIPMAAHASLKKDDAKSMAKYILSLKK